MDNSFGKSLTPDLAIQIANRIYENPKGSENIVQLLQSLNLISEEIQVPNELTQPDNVLAFLHTDPDACAIWSPDPENRGGFHRKEGLEFCEPLFATTKHIPARSDKKRIILTGESVARGFLVDPGFTPAQCLEQMLSCAEIPGGVEVIDMAMIGVKPCRGADLASRAVDKLKPDLLIMFAGNNIALKNIISPKDSATRLMNSEYLQKNGVPAFNKYLKDKIINYIHEYVRSLKNLDVPVFFLIPDSNLADWKFMDDVPAPWLENTTNKRWMNLYLKGIQALEEGKLAKAEQCGITLMEIDQIASASGVNILSESLRRQGRYLEAEQVTSEGLSATDYCYSIPGCPRTRPVVRETLKSALTLMGIPFLDIRDILNVEGKNPGRNAFLDYCHLNLSGIQTIMAQVANHLAPHLGGRAVPVTELKNMTHDIDPFIEGTSHFLAAIHNAHWGQSFEIISYHIKCALEIWPELSEMMELYLNVSSGNVPRWMNKSMTKFFDHSNKQFIRYLCRFDSEIRFDGILLETIANVLEQQKPGIRDKLEKNRRCNFARMGTNNSSDLDLTLGYYAAHESVIEFRKYDLVLSLFFPIFKRSFSIPEYWSNLCLKMTVRGVDIAPGEGVIYMNQKKVATFSVVKGWQNHEILIPAEILRSSRNNICIKWPTEIVKPTTTNKRFIEAIDCLDFRKLFPVLVQITRLALCNVQNPLILNSVNPNN